MAAFMGHVFLFTYGNKDGGLPKFRKDGCSGCWWMVSMVVDWRLRVFMGMVCRDMCWLCGWIGDNLPLERFDSR